MSRRKRVTPHVSHERWLVSYADFITLLFAFFVVLYAAAEIDKKKIGQVAASIQVAFQQMGAFPASSTAYSQGSSQVPPQTALPPLPAPEAHPAALPPKSAVVPSLPAQPLPNGPELSALRTELEQVLAKEIARGEVAIAAGREGLVVSLREVGFFDSGSAGVKARSLPAFSRMAELLAQRQFSIRIEGHTDDVPIHNSQFGSNWELSTARATEIVQLLITNYHIPPHQLSAAGYAEYHPVASNDTNEGRAQNRRVDIVIVGRTASTP